VQPQLAGQHHAGRPAAGNYHVNHEGFILTKVVVQIGDSKYKFSVFNSKKWAKEIETQKALFNKQ